MGKEKGKKSCQPFSPNVQLLTVPMLSSQPFSWGLRLQELGQGVHTGDLEADFHLKTTISNYIITLKSVRRGLQEI
jgi:hypothetical protein